MICDKLCPKLTGPFKADERGDLEVTCSTLKTAKEPLEVFRLSRRFFCRGSLFLWRAEGLTARMARGKNEEKRKIFHISFFIVSVLALKIELWPDLQIGVADGS